ncbi:hypothetical protein [Deinococcus sp. SL84]|uniref:hypothetical protein n=1 Tax=Deinococcus sp. SL84 TaxID=2994663 RepID=UPI002276CAB5|nr:hypothetical protein [Deinococcus sp. SL84]MCY1703994.1 hypothetical protein [Deinococcus sp. SL84]
MRKKQPAPQKSKTPEQAPPDPKIVEKRRKFKASLPEPQRSIGAQLKWLYENQKAALSDPANLHDWKWIAKRVAALIEADLPRRTHKQHISIISKAIETLRRHDLEKETGIKQQLLALSYLYRKPEGRKPKAEKTAGKKSKRLQKASGQSSTKQGGFVHGTSLITVPTRSIRRWGR